MWYYPRSRTAASYAAKYRYTYGQVSDQVHCVFLVKFPRNMAHKPTVHSGRDMILKSISLVLFEQALSTEKKTTRTLPPAPLDQGFQPAFSDEADESPETSAWRRGQQVLHKALGARDY